MAKLRALKILLVLCQYRLDRQLTEFEGAPLWLHTLLLPLKLLPAKEASKDVAVRAALVTLGPIFIKFGQLLSTRKDILSTTLAEELEMLQDRVPPFSSEQSLQIIETNLGRSIPEVFSHLEHEPLASASVAQVHSGVLLCGEQVVVKVIRPGISAIIQRDLDLLARIAELLTQFWPDLARLRLSDIVTDYRHTILDELDLELERENTQKLRANWQNSGKLYVPMVYPELSNKNILVMEKVSGIVVTDLNELNKRQVNLRKLAHLGVEIFFTQVFEDNFFHADMHPGNVLVNASDPENPTYIALDCAIIGVLSADDQKYLAKNLLAFFNADYRAVALAHIESGWVPADTDIDAFEKVIAEVCRPIFGKPMREIRFAGLLIALFNTAREFNMEVQPQLVLLQKTLLNIEGIGRQIYADLDLWETAAPFMKRWMKKQTGFVHFMDELKSLAPAALAELPELPRNLLFAAREIKQISLNQRQQARLLTTLKSDLQHFHKFSRTARLTTVGLGLALGFAVVPGLQLNLDQGLLIGTIILGTIALYLLISRP